MKNTIIEILENVIDDFNSKWQNHDEAQDGLEEYVENILRVFEERLKQKK